MTTELDAETKEPHPLKGIINTNDDPFACALCHDSVREDTTFLTIFTMFCCGKGLCEPCYESCEYDRECWIARACLVCPGSRQKDPIKALKKHAKKGHPWAHHFLGDLYFHGSGVRKSYLEASRWFDFAAKKGHPEALMEMGMIYLNGEPNVAVDLSKAEVCFETALSVLPSMDYCRDFLLEIAKEHQRANTDESNAKAKSILLSITKGPINTNDPAVYDQSDALYRLGRFHYKDGSIHDAYEALVSCMICAGEKKVMGEVVHFAMLCAGQLGLEAQARFWFCKVKLSEIIDHDFRRMAAKDYFWASAKFREQRDTCGGCGAQFEGKDRKYCRRCRTFCYCSRDCQKLHWNRKEDGHREDCLGLKELKEQLMEVENEKK